MIEYFLQHTRSTCNTGIANILVKQSNWIDSG